MITILFTGNMNYKYFNVTNIVQGTADGSPNYSDVLTFRCKNACI